MYVSAYRRAYYNAVLVKLVCIALSTANSRAQCVDLFRQSPQLFHVCTHKICILFQEENSDVILDARMRVNDTSAQQPFLCKDRFEKYPRLRGTSFVLLDKVPSLHDSYCVYVGSEDCTFDGMVQFANTAAINGYQFIVGGYLVFLTHRMKEHVFASAPTFEGMFVIVGKRTSGIKRIKEAFRDIFKPFQRDAWIVTASFACLLILCTYMSLALTARSIHPLRVFDELFADATTEMTTVRSMWRLLVITITVFFAVFVMLFELAVTVILFEGSLQNVDPSLSAIPKSELHKFVVQGGGASEFVFRIRVDEQQEYTSETKPWRTARFAGEMIEMVLDESNDVQFLVMSDQAVSLELHQRQLCNKLVVLENIQPAFKYVGGWYYTDRVKPTIRRAIDESILRARELSAAKNIANNPELRVLSNCAAVRNRIDDALVIAVLLCTVVPLLLLYFANFLYNAVVIYRERKPVE